MLLHTILELDRGPDGKLRICYQYDHTMWLESLLYLNMPRLVGDFFIDYYRPSMGRCVFCNGRMICVWLSWGWACNGSLMHERSWPCRTGFEEDWY